MHHRAFVNNSLSHNPSALCLTSLYDWSSLRSAGDSIVSPVRD